MQQYFVEKELKVKDIIALDEDVLYHLRKVLRKNDEYVFRIVDITKAVFHCRLINNQQCQVIEKLSDNNELNTDITCILSLIRPEKFEFAVQKLCEIGVKRIVPYKAKRSVIADYDNKRIDRIRKIAKEACEQSHRNVVCEITQTCDISNLSEYLSENNYICYEKESTISLLPASSSLTYIIGPEGGFDIDEYFQIVSLGFDSISLGKSILRSETAAIYLGSIVRYLNQ